MAEESNIQKGIVDYLQMLENMGKVYFFRNNSFAGTFKRANGSNGYVKNNKPGMPDIICLYQGKYVGIEVKSSKGKQTPEQKKAQEDIERLGGIYLLVRSLEEVTSVIK